MVRQTLFSRDYWNRFKEPLQWSFAVGLDSTPNTRESGNLYSRSKTEINTWKIKKKHQGA